MSFCVHIKGFYYDVCASGVEVLTLIFRVSIVSFILRVCIWHLSLCSVLVCAYTIIVVHM